jgi:hypothetical protein
MTKLLYWKNTMTNKQKEKIISAALDSFVDKPNTPETRKEIVDAILEVAKKLTEVVTVPRWALEFVLNTSNHTDVGEWWRSEEMELALKELRESLG